MLEGIVSIQKKSKIEKTKYKLFHMVQTGDVVIKLKDIKIRISEVTSKF